MTETTTAQGGEATALSRLADFGTMLRRSDIALAVGMMAILVILILPLPPVLLDFSLAISITFSVLILMTSAVHPGAARIFLVPTVLLIATMLRLALNLASTRLILAHGHEGTAAAGHVIQAFGNFVMGGNFVIGIIVFTILVIVNFVVTPRARDASPKWRRAFTSIPCRASRWPSTPISMPASSTKRTRGAGARHWRTNRLFRRHGRRLEICSWRRHCRAPCRDDQRHRRHDHRHRAARPQLRRRRPGLTRCLTVGDGLVTQIPALIVSTAAGLLVSKAGRSRRRRQGAAQPVSPPTPRRSACRPPSCWSWHWLPGIPMIPFLLLGGGTGAVAFTIDRRAKKVGHRRGEKGGNRQSGARRKSRSQPRSRLDDLKIELGYALLPMVNGPTARTG